MFVGYPGCQPFDEVAEVNITPQGARWIGPPGLPLPVSYSLIREGVMERLSKFGPFIQVADDRLNELRYFVRAEYHPGFDGTAPDTRQLG